jgi:phosphoribosyl-AMP cyclohydrolase
MSESLSPEAFVQAVKFDDKGLVPTVAQSAATGEILMLAWMNRDTLAQTLASGRVTYWSRSRQSAWTKGETSGHHQHLIEARLDCDGDAIVLKVDQMGPACHTGAPSCFYRRAE